MGQHKKPLKAPDLKISRQKFESRYYKYTQKRVTRKSSG